MRQGLPRRALLSLTVAAVVGVQVYGCALNTEGEGSLNPEGGTAGGGGTAGSGGTYVGDGGPDTPDAYVPDIQAPDGKTCFPPEKLCDDACVSPENPEYGCTTAGCTPCSALAHAVIGCNSGECLVSSCEAGWGNCDSDPTTGCETPLRDLSNCGDCGTPCSLPHANATCSTGTCAIETCDAGWGDCNSNPGDGCETDLRTLENCAGCGTDCTVPSGTPTCVSGTCLVDNCDTENTGMADCDGLASNGCETDVRTRDNCGTCGNACAADHVTAWACNGAGGTSTYTCAINSCETTWGNCDNLPGNGCETDTRVSVDNCGSCGGVCSGAHAATRACINGQCDPTCSTGYADCDGPVAGSNDDGCETDTHTVTNCGTCGSACTLPHAVESCSSGVCAYTSCDSGWDDCDSNTGNGCETDLHTLANCGACGAACALAHAPETCPNGTCTLGTCDTGWGNCDSNPANGCERNLTTLTDCGGCGTACNLAHAPETCPNGTCTLGTCDAGWGNCDGNTANGCEQALNTLTHCGGCGQGCNLTNAAETCPNGVCTLGACDGGWGNCDNNPANGCERSLTTTSDCGSCGQGCNLANASETCTTGTCTLGTCDGGWANCDSDPLNGCETNTSTSESNCGGCGFDCSNSHVSARICVNSKCGPTCSTDWGDCNGPQAGDVDDGCETNTTTTTNCLTCGTSCSAPSHATAACGPTGCSFACVAKFDNCDGLEANGCECFTDDFNCSSGACECKNNPACKNGGACTAGLCVCSGAASSCQAGQICDSSDNCVWP